MTDVGGVVDVEAARAAYERDGQWSAPALFSAEEVERFRAGAARVVAGEHRTGRAPALRLPADPGPHDLHKIDDAWWADPDLAALATDRRVTALAAALLDAPEVRIWQDQLLVKPAGDPAATAQTATIGWHQDWASWEPVASHGAFVTAWVALDDVDEDNGAMQVLPGSQTWGLVEGGSNFFASDRDGQLAGLGADRQVEPRTVALPLGAVSFHHPLTFHGSGPNRAARPRRALAIHYVDGRVTAADKPGLWQHYNLALFRERGGQVGEPYRFDDLCPLVHP